MFESCAQTCVYQLNPHRASLAGIRYQGTRYPSTTPVQFSSLPARIRSTSEKQTIFSHSTTRSNFINNPTMRVSVFTFVCLSAVVNAKLAVRTRRHAIVHSEHKNEGPDERALVEEEEETYFGRVMAGVSSYPKVSIHHCYTLIVHHCAALLECFVALSCWKCLDFICCAMNQFKLLVALDFAKIICNPIFNIGRKGLPSTNR